jgi:hypothetical protein
MGVHRPSNPARRAGSRMWNAGPVETRMTSPVASRTHHGQCLRIVGQFDDIEVEQQSAARRDRAVHGIEGLGQRRVVEERRESEEYQAEWPALPLRQHSVQGGSVDAV